MPAGQGLQAQRTRLEGRLVADDAPAIRRPWEPAGRLAESSRSSSVWTASIGRSSGSNGRGVSAAERRRAGVRRGAVELGQCDVLFVDRHEHEFLDEPLRDARRGDDIRPESTVEWYEMGHTPAGVVGRLVDGAARSPVPGPVARRLDRQPSSGFRTWPTTTSTR